MKTVSKMTFFLLLTSYFLLSSCSSHPQQPELQIKVTMDGSSRIYDVPAEIPVGLGKEITIEALVPAPYKFVSWTGSGLNGIKENPYTFQFEFPNVILISYETTIAYDIVIDSVLFSDNKNFEFDVLLENHGAEFKVTSYQAAISFDENIKGNGTLSFKYVEGSTGLPNSIIAADIYQDNDFIKLGFASSPNPEGSVISSKVRLGRFRLTNSVEFASFDPNLQLHMTGNPGTIITGENFADITQFAAVINPVAVLAMLKFIKP